MKEQIKRIVQQAFDVPADALQEHDRIDQLDAWDSMAHMFFITKIEDAFEVELSGDEIVEMTSVAAIDEILSRHNVTVSEN